MSRTKLKYLESIGTPAPSNAVIAGGDSIEEALSKLQGQINLLGIGKVGMFAHTSPDPGWLLCDGSAVSRATYAALFGKIGTAYGAGDGSTTFNLPNQVSHFAIGNTPGATGGANTDDLSHTHAVDPPSTTSSGPSALWGERNTTVDNVPGPTDTHTHTVDIPSFTSGSGGNASHDNRPAFVGYAFYIFAGV